MRDLRHRSGKGSTGEKNPVRHCDKETKVNVMGQRKRWKKAE